MENNRGRGVCQCYHASYYSTVSLKEMQSIIGQGQRKEKELICYVSFHFLLLFGYHPVFIACLIQTLSTPLDGYSESQILYFLKHYFIQIWKCSGSQKPVCTLAAGREALEFQDGDWSSSGYGTIWAQSGLVICRDS